MSEDNKALEEATKAISAMKIVPPEEAMYILIDKTTGKRYDIRNAKIPGYTDKIKVVPNRMWEEYYKYIEDQGEKLRQIAEDGNLNLIMDLFSKKSIFPYINKANLEGWAALHFAAKEGYPKICEYLISQHADINLKTIDGRTPLHFACVIGNEEVIKLLIEKGANINETTKDFNTPTHLLAKFGCCGALKLMLLYKPNLDILNKEKMNAIEMSNSPETVNVFKSLLPPELFAKLTSKSAVKLLQSEEKPPVHDSKSSIKLKVKDFDFFKRLGKGSFGEVYLVKKKGNPKFYAMKVLDKHQVQKINLARYVLTEKNVMAQYFHPFICSLEYSFQSAEKLFLVMKYCPAYKFNIVAT